MATATSLVEAILAHAMRRGATELLLVPGPRSTSLLMRVGGHLERLAGPSEPLADAAVARLKALCGLDIAERRLPQKGVFLRDYDERSVEVWVRTQQTPHGERVQVQFRARRRGPTRLEVLGFSERDLARYRALLERGRGLILHAGGQGSGLTTTLLAAAGVLHRLEYPVVALVADKPCHVAGLPTEMIGLSPAADRTAAASAFMDPRLKAIALDEPLARTSLDGACRAALAGKCVLAGWRAPDAFQALYSARDAGEIEPVVAAVCGQRLLRRLCPRCRQAYPAPEREARRLGLSATGAPQRLYRAGSCRDCSHTGYQGHVAVFELLVVTPEVRAALRRDAPPEELRARAEGAGFIGLRPSAASRVAQGATSAAEAKSLGLY